MSTRSIVAAVFLIALGILMGVVLVSSYKGVDLSFAGDQQVQLGSQSSSLKTNPTLLALNEAMHSIAKEVTPTVVYIMVQTKPSSGSGDDANRFFRFFGPDFKFDTPRPHPEIGAGSGVILSSNGYILTNNHVIGSADPDKIEVTLSDNRKFKAKLTGTDEFTDLGVIKIDADNLPVPKLGNSDDVEVGHLVFAFGNPLQLTSTMTQGIVSATGRQIGILNDQQGYGIENFIQTDAAVNPGNSGGALVDIKGDVIGINTAIATTNQRYQGYSFAIPVNMAKKVASDIIKYGKVRRGYIGVNIQTVDATFAKANGFDKPKGVIIQNVNSGSAGEDAGLKAGDVILSVDGREVNSANQLQSVIAARYPGDVVTLQVFRDGRTIEKKVTLKAREADEDKIVAARDRSSKESKPKGSTAPTKVTLDALGLTVRDIDTQVKKEYDVENGVLVENVEPFSEAYTRGLAQNDVILSVGDQKVSSAAAFKEILGKKKPGDAVLMRVKQANKSMKFVAVEVPPK